MTHLKGELKQKQIAIYGREKIHVIRFHKALSNGVHALYKHSI